MTQEDLEFQISQYADGSLPVEQRAIVEEAIRADAGAQKALRDYQKLDLEFSGLRTPPAVRWDRLAKHLSDVVAVHHQTTERPAVAGRIFPILSSWQMRSAVAALVMFAVGGTLWMKGHHAAAPVTAIHPTDSTAMVIGPQAEVGTGPASEEIKIGPSRALAQHMDAWRYADGVVTHGLSKVTITAGLTPVPHTDSHLH